MSTCRRSVCKSSQSFSAQSTSCIERSMPHDAPKREFFLERREQAKDEEKVKCKKPTLHACLADAAPMEPAWHVLLLLCIASPRYP